MASNDYKGKNILEKSNINLDGEKQSIKYLIETYMNYIDDKRVVFTIYAEFVSACA